MISPPFRSIPDKDLEDRARTDVAMLSRIHQCLGFGLPNHDRTHLFLSNYLADSCVSFPLNHKQYVFWVYLPVYLSVYLPASAS